MMNINPPILLPSNLSDHNDTKDQVDLAGYVQLTNDVQTINAVSHVTAFHLVGCPVQTEDDDPQVTELDIHSLSGDQVQQDTMVVESAMSNHFIDEDYCSERSGFLDDGYFQAPRDEIFE